MKCQSYLLGRKIILLVTGHLALNAALLAIGKELFIEMVPAAQMLFLNDFIEETERSYVFH